jgi:hypothetical protein
MHPPLQGSGSLSGPVNPFPKLIILLGYCLIIVLLQPTFYARKAGKDLPDVLSVWLMKRRLPIFFSLAPSPKKSGAL